MARWRSSVAFADPFDAGRRRRPVVGSPDGLAWWVRTIPITAALAPYLREHALRSGRRTGLVFGATATRLLDSRRPYMGHSSIAVTFDLSATGRPSTSRELMVGVELADAQRRPTRAATVDAILATFDVIAFDIEIARHHAALLAHARRTGRPRGAHDLQIAATARATGRVLITTDAHAFDDLPAVGHRVIPPG